MSGVDAEIMAPKSDPEGKFNDPMYCVELPGLVVSNLKRPEAADATDRAV
jgi:hypothetical protein